MRIHENIEKYIHGELNQDEIDLLWIEFLRDPDLFGYFETLLHLRHILRNQTLIN